MIEVVAGRFDHCIRIEAIGARSVPTDRGNARATVNIVHRQWFSLNVGLVKSVREETSPSPFLVAGYYEQELLRYGR